MGKSVGKKGEMRYTGIVANKKGKDVGESYRDSSDREWIQKRGEGTPSMSRPGQSRKWKEQ